MSPSERYTRTAVVLHWAIAALVMAQFTWGWWMQTIPKQPVGMRADAFNLHKSVGLTILALTLVRLAWRISHRPPALPRMPAWQRRLAQLNHRLLYVAVIGMPLAGYLGSAWSGYPVKYFGWTLPAWSARDDELKNLMSLVHLTLSWVLLASLVLHVAAVVKHTVQGGRVVLARMSIPRNPRRGTASLAPRPR